MDDGFKGKLILRQAPSEVVRGHIIELLLKHTKNTSREKLSELLNQAPFTIAKNISQAPGEKMAEMLKSLGADTEFVPEHQPK